MKYTTKIITLKNVLNNYIEIYIYHLVLSNFSKIKDIIEREIIDIWEPNIGYTLDEVKKDIYKNVQSKRNIQKYGICAEFFMHLFLRDLGYEQKCLFSNLEEKSMKKGFDGFYEYTNEFWIAESKCSFTSYVKHKDKIKEALNDIDGKISNTKENDPWKNALHHIMIRDKGKENESLLKKVKNLSRDFTNNIPHNSSEFNLIPASTLFINNDQSDEEIKEEIEKMISNRKIKAMIILCINNNIYDEFIDYLKGE